MPTENIEPAGDEPAGRWELIRDIAVFQLKLIVDGFRDLLLVPISLVAGVASLLSGGSKPGTEFYDLLRFGRRSEHWINLFGAAERVHGPSSADENFAGGDIDRFAQQIETFVVSEYRKGGVTKQARERLDKAIDHLQKASRRTS
jgi:hypothetical protein